MKLELLQICYNKSKNILEQEFRDVMEKHLKKLRKIIKKEFKTIKQYEKILKNVNLRYFCRKEIDIK